MVRQKTKLSDNYAFILLTGKGGKKYGQES